MPSCNRAAITIAMLKKHILFASILAACAASAPAFASPVDAGLSAGTLGYGPQVGLVMQSDLNNFQWYPVVQVGLVYRF